MRDFNTTVGMLVKAYLNNTLEHGSCYACAVGNIIASCNSIEYEDKEILNHKIKSWIGMIPVWVDVFVTDNSDDEQYLNPKAYRGAAKEQIDSTGYSWQELAKIEKAFESISRSLNRDERMFEGLMAVVDVLAEIHEVDLTTKEQAKLLFV